MTAELCSWAACHEAAHEFADGWLHCKTHLLMHRLLSDDRPITEKNLHAAMMTDAVAQLHEAGMSDQQMADVLEISASRVSHYRRRSGLEPNTPPRKKWKDAQPCGTRAAYRRHLRDKEVPCADCSAAETRLRQAHYRRTGR